MAPEVPPGYAGSEGPEHWGILSKEYALCREGKSQSPINITGERDMKLSAIEFHYQASVNSEVINNGHTIQVNYHPGSYAVIGGKKYNLLQFHFHSPSEHKVHGKHADMVSHLVHKSDDGHLAVVGVLFDKSRNNDFLTPVWGSMPSTQGKATVAGSIDINRLLPADKGYFHYSGSLTTPPCSEGVSWNVLKSHVSVGSAQVTAFTSIFPTSIRPVQPINGRTVGVLH